MTRLEAHPRALRWVGRRGAVLLLFGVGYVVYGARVVSEPIVTDPDRALLHYAVPAGWRAAVWITAGLIAVLTPTVRRYTGRLDTAGFVVALLPPLATSASYLIAWFVWLLPLAIEGDSAGWGSAAIWAVLAGVILIVAGWPEATRFPSTREDADG